MFILYVKMCLLHGALISHSLPSLVLGLVCTFKDVSVHGLFNDKATASIIHKANIIAYQYINTMYKYIHRPSDRSKNKGVLL